MKHFGDITQIHGWDVPIVDVVTGGSPCQDLSVAGRRAGLNGERSGLFMEQIRIVKEMRDHDRRTNGRTDKHIRPRYMVWENVAGAFSSGNPKGADFKAVLEEICKIVCKNIPDIPIPKEGWHYAGCIDGMGDDGFPFSIAWRLHDAQYWGVPQRRNRISLVADFGGKSSSQILFEPKSLCRDNKQDSKKRQDASRGAEGCINPAISFQERSGKAGGGKGILIQRDHVGALSTLNNQAVVFRKKTHPHNKQEPQEWVKTVISDTLNVNDSSEGHSPLVVLQDNAVIRRFTPLEYERLQGFPDGWTDIGEWIDSKGKKHRDADSPRYKALGNSIALPFWEWMAGRMVKYIPDNPTMASLFDGIGGFPLVFSRCGCKPVWASEIEEFPIAVTKRRFGNE